MIVRQITDVMNGDTRLKIYDRRKNETLFDDAAHSLAGQYDHAEVLWLRVIPGGLQIEVNEPVNRIKE